MTRNGMNINLEWVKGTSQMYPSFEDAVKVFYTFMFDARYCLFGHGFSIVTESAVPNIPNTVKLWLVMPHVTSVAL